MQVAPLSSSRGNRLSLLLPIFLCAGFAVFMLISAHRLRLQNNLFASGRIREASALITRISEGHRRDHQVMTMIYFQYDVGSEVYSTHELVTPAERQTWKSGAQVPVNYLLEDPQVARLELPIENAYRFSVPAKLIRSALALVGLCLGMLALFAFKGRRRGQRAALTGRA